MIYDQRLWCCHLVYSLKVRQPLLVRAYMDPEWTVELMIFLISISDFSAQSLGSQRLERFKEQQLGLFPKIMAVLATTSTFMPFTMLISIYEVISFHTWLLISITSIAYIVTLTIFSLWQKRRHDPPYLYSFSSLCTPFQPISKY